MKRSRIHPIFKAVPVVAALAALIASGMYALSAQQGVAVASSNLNACQELSAGIQRLEQRAQHASLVSRSLADLADLVESAAKDAGLASDSIVRIDPQAVRRIGDSDYQEQATAVELLSATLAQLKKLVEGIAARDSKLEVRTVRLRSPHEVSGEEAADQWIVDMVLTQRIYAPKSSRP